MLPRLRARDLLIVLTRVVAVLAALELGYLLGGNLVVKSGLIKRAVASAQGFDLECGSAYTILPGRVHVSDFSLRFEDYNVQFEIAFDRAQVDISLSDLLWKRFRVTRLEAQGTRFRMRHKLIAVGDDAERVAAYPPIRGFADPPFYVGLRPSSRSDAEAAELWEVRVENVVGSVSELWVMEQRFRGEGRVAGSFVVRPTRWVQVWPAELKLSRGRLTLGEHVVAEQLSGRISCEVPDYHVQASEGRQVFREISTRVDLQLSRGKLDFLRAYLARLGPVRYSGDAAWQLALRIRNGRVEPGTRVSLLATPLTLHHPEAEVSGDVMLSFGRYDTGAPDRLALALSAPRLVTRTERRGAKGPSFEGVEAGLLVDAVDLTGEMSIGRGQLAVRRAHAPSLRWFQTKATRLDGEANAQLSLARHSDGTLFGRANFAAPALSVRRGTFAADAAASGSVALTRSASGRELQASELALQLSQARVQSGDKRSKPFDLSLDAAGLRITPSDSPSARGQVLVQVSSAEALLPLLVGNVLREVGDAALDLQTLDARAQLELERDGLTLSRIDARSGRLRLQGHVEKRDQHPSGALLFSSGFIHVGVTLKGGETELRPFVGDNWLTSVHSGAGS